MRIERSLITMLGAPIVVGMAIALASPITAGASNGLAFEMSADVGNASFYQCATGYNQNTFAPNPQTNKCWYLSSYHNLEWDWWWCSKAGVYAFDCGNPWASSGYTVTNAWFDYYHNWITNTSDNIGAYPQYLCCGNTTGGDYQDFYRVFGP